jgi:hypothetical protein
VISLIIQISALLRGLRIEDDAPPVYRRTILIFTWGVFVLLVAIPVEVIGMLDIHPYFSNKVSIWSLVHGEMPK